jgi:hypothetical protein
VAAVELKGTKNGIAIEIRQRGLCDVFLDIADERIRLGLEDIQKVVSKLLKGMDTKASKEIYSYRGEENIYVIVVLMDPHMILTGRVIADGMEVLFLDKNCNFLPSAVILSRYDMDAWIHILRYTDWLGLRKNALENELQTGNEIRYNLEYADKAIAMLANTGECAKECANSMKAITVGELRYLRDNWDRFKNAVKFYDFKREVAAPWLPYKGEGNKQ